MATALGKTAVDLIAQGNYSQMVAWQNGQVVAVPLAEVIAQSPSPVKSNSYLISTAEALGIYVGNCAL
jgi:6-phosphofructokinase 1